MKSHEKQLLGAELFHAGRQTYRCTDGRTDGEMAEWAEGRTEMTKLTLTFRNF